MILLQWYQTFLLIVTTIATTTAHELKTYGAVC